MPSKLLKNYPYARQVITHEEYDYIYLSPHLDDVVLSCSGTICTHQRQGLRSLVVTLFAGEPQPPFPAVARAFHQLWEIPEGTSPYQIRRAEDERAMSVLGVDYLWLNWLELIYRIPDLTDLSEISDEQVDFQHDPIQPALRQWLEDLRAAYPQATIVAPLGIGRHRDHRMIFQTALNVLDPATLLFFEDFPYVAYLPEDAKELAETHHLTPLEVDISRCLEQRMHATELYQSQLTMLFYPPSSLRDMIREYIGMGEQRFIERYWKLS